MGREKVCYVSETARLGGGEFSLLSLIERAGPQYEPFVITYGEGPLTDRLVEMGITFRSLPRDGLISQARLVTQLRRFFRDNDIRICHVNTLDIRAAFAARIAGTRLIGHLRVIMPFTWVDRLFVRLSHRVIAVSEAARDALVSNRSGLASKFTVIHNGIPEPSGTIDIKAELGLPATSRVIGAVGRFDPVKGFEDLIESLPRIHETCGHATHVVIAGEPGGAALEQTYDRSLKALAARLAPDHVHFLGFRRDAARLVGSFDILAVPSIVRKTPKGVWAEGFGRVAAEAMAFGVPVIAARTGGLPEIVIDGVTGYLISPGSPAELADAATRILTNKDLMNAMSAASRDRYERSFTLDTQMQRIKQVYGDLCARV